MTDGTKFVELTSSGRCLSIRIYLDESCVLKTFHLSSMPPGGNFQLCQTVLSIILIFFFHLKMQFSVFYYCKLDIGKFLTPCGWSKLLEFTKFNRGHKTYAGFWVLIMIELLHLWQIAIKIRRLQAWLLFIPKLKYQWIWFMENFSLIFFLISIVIWCFPDNLHKFW